MLLGCASIQNAPVNQPGSSADLAGQLHENFEERAASRRRSGRAVVLGGRHASRGLFLRRVGRNGAHAGARRQAGQYLIGLDFISGVSGGSVTAAYYGLRKRAALADFREKFLLRNAEEGLETDLNLATLGKAFAGGINDSRGLPRWLDANLFHGATFADLRKTVRPRVWINASDIYNRTPFVFGVTAFRAMCSDLASYPLANAVAASAAVPVAFAPVVIQTFPGRCNDPLPAWIVKARDNRNAPPMLSAFAKAVSRYHDGEMPYIKLLDGGLVDNYGLSGFTIARLSADTPYDPLSPQRAVKLRRGLFLVVDAKTGVAGNWINTVEGPSGVDLVKAAAEYRDQCQCRRRLHRVRADHGGLAGIADPVALRPVSGGPRPLRRASGLELPRSETVRRADRLRSTRFRACRQCRSCSDPLSLAAAAGG